MSKKPEHPRVTIQNEKGNAHWRPGTAGAGRNVPPPPPSKYEEMQRDEIEVLRSIFMDDYQDVESKKAWSKATERTFKIKLSAYTDKNIWVILVVTITATYPKTVPLLYLEEVGNVRAQTLEKVHSIIATKPKELLGEVMVHDIASMIQDELEDAASARAKGEQLPSLEQERAVHEASAFELARSQEEAMRKRDREEKEEAERKMQRTVDEQIKKRAEARQNIKTDSSVAEPDLDSTFVTLTFDQSITTVDDTAQEQIFRSVSLISLLRQGPVTEVHSAMPVIHRDRVQALALKRARLKSCRSKDSVLELEKLLEKLKRIRNPYAINVLGFKVTSESESWHFDILTELGNQGSLLDMLNVVDVLPVQRARLFSIELLQALDFYHRNGVVHGRIHAGNLIFNRASSGSVSLKLADAGFQDSIHVLRNIGEPNGASLTSLWCAPEFNSSTQVEKSKRSDIWDFGVVLVEMLVGLAVTQRSSSPAIFMNSTALSEPFEDLARDLFKPDPRKRPNAFDITPYEFFRADIPALAEGSNLTSRSASFTGAVASSVPKRLRHESSAGQGPMPKLVSRYASEWDEVGRLGKGGFGEVVKARNKLDGRIYAIKKIMQKTPAELSQVLSEAYLLATLNHPFCVRYFTAWPEDDAPAIDDVSEDITSSEDVGFFGMGSKALSTDFGPSTGGLDFISSSGYPKIEFGYDDDDEEAISEDEDEDSASVESPEAAKLPHRSSSASDSLVLQRTRSVSRPAVKSTLFIQMEFCERHTLRDIIRKGMQHNLEETWRLFRQILEGLCHIHSHGIIHRDLKPENIFIDSANNTKIGDFGLATSGQFNLVDVDAAAKSVDGEMTRNVGTTFYVAPELQANIKGNYSDKIDMYSLGIIFFEMCHPLKTAMERSETLTALRDSHHTLPSDFQNSDKAVQGEIIESLLKHRPSERPSSAELLRSGKVPLQIEDETIRVALDGLADDNSPYYHRMMSALFSKSSGHQIKAQMWDTSAKDIAQTPNVEFVLLQSMVHERIASCFRRHGAVESQRQGLIPRSDYYQNKNVVTLLDASGTLVQLPYDFTLPHARAVAKQALVADKSYAIGHVYRDALTGGPPRSSREADFDIVTYDDKDLALKEAEVIKVVDELLDEFPPLASASMCFHISHSRLLDHIMEFCRVAQPQKAAAKEVLGRLNIQQWTWQKIRLELRGPSIGVSSTSLDELTQFDFRDTPEKALTRLQSIFAGTDYLAKLHEIFTQVSGMVEYCKRWGVKRKIYFSPLSSFNDRFYEGGVMFQCLFDSKRRDVVAAGGRYDNLVEELRPRMTGSVSRGSLHAVGVNIAWDRLVTSMARYQNKFSSGSAFLKKAEELESPAPWPTRRCDCLVASFDSAVLRSTGIRLVSSLWSNDISAELAVDVRTPEELLTHYREDKHSWIITIKHDAAASSRADLKVKCMDKKEDFDVRSSDLLTFIRGEIRDRDQREGANERLRLLRQHAGGDFSSSSGPGDGGKSAVHVLTASHKSKKSNKYRVVEAAQAASQELLRTFTDGPVASIETRDEVLDMIRETRLSDAESWRRIVQKVPLNERHYIQEVQELLAGFKSKCLEEGGTGAAFVFNFRTGKCLFYDLMV